MTDQAVLEALAQGSSFEVFRSEYDRVYRAMKRSLLTEKTLLEKVRVEEGALAFARPFGGSRAARSVESCRTRCSTTVRVRWAAVAAASPTPPPLAAIKLQKAVRLKQADDVTIAELRKARGGCRCCERLQRVGWLRVWRAGC